MLDVDSDTAPSEVVETLHGQGRKAVCYISAGSWENWRPDAATFPAAVIGSADGWPGEKWLDIREPRRRSGRSWKRGWISAARKASTRIEPADVDGYTNSTRFPLTAQDQLRYNTLPRERRARARAVGGLEERPRSGQRPAASFDWALNEECFQIQGMRPARAIRGRGQTGLQRRIQGGRGGDLRRHETLGVQHAEKAPGAGRLSRRLSVAGRPSFADDARRRGRCSIRPDRQHRRRSLNRS